MKFGTLKSTVLFSALILAVFFTASCSKSGGNSSVAYPKNVTILYKLTPSGGYTTGDVGYLNETGSVTYLTNQSLPFTKQITRTVNKNDAASLNVSSIGNGSIKLEIFVDGNLVKTETPSGNVVNTTIVHLFQ